jgi:hypothetical protein
LQQPKAQVLKELVPEQGQKEQQQRPQEQVRQQE